MSMAPSGVLPIDKPSGWSSFDVVAVARRVTGVRRVGHGGTLDPLATGLLPILVGPATKFADRLHTAAKVYAALVTLGSETATDDREGARTRSAPVPDIAGRAIEKALDAFRGEISQVPPAYAAIRVDGKHAYARARAGETVVMRPRTVTIERIAVAGWEPPELRLLVVCSTGTYIRSLARDIGQALGSAAHLGGLRRLAVGALTVDDALSVDALRTMPGGGVQLRPADDRILELAARFREAPAADLLANWGRAE